LSALVLEMEWNARTKTMLINMTTSVPRVVHTLGGECCW